MNSVGIQTAADAETSFMLATGHFMAFAGHVFIKVLMIGTSFKNPTAANSLISPE
jgi:hypothetical protein